MAVVVFVSSAGLGVSSGDAAIGGPPSSMAGPTTFAAVGPTAIPASSPGDATTGPGATTKPGTTQGPGTDPTQGDGIESHGRAHDQADRQTDRETGGRPEPDIEPDLEPNIEPDHGAHAQAHRRPTAELGEVHPLPVVQRVEPAHRQPAGPQRFRDPHQLDRAQQLPAPGLQLDGLERWRGLRDPVQQGHLVDADLQRRLLLRRLGRRPVPDPGESQDRERQRRAPARVGHRGLLPVRDLRRVEVRREVDAAAPARSGTCAPTRSAPTAGRAPTPRACRSCPGSSGTTRLSPA